MRYLYPSKPILISKNQDLFKNLKTKGYIPEIKFNGDRCELLLTKTNGIWEFWNRHGSKFTHYTPHPDLLKEIGSLKVEGDVQLDGELLHFKVEGIKHILVLYDIYIWDGKPLVDKTFAERRVMLDGLFDSKPDLHSFLSNNPNFSKHLLLSPQLDGDFPTLFEEITKYGYIEGMVMKDPKAKLVYGLKSCPVNPWQFKVRKPCGKYSH